MNRDQRLAEIRRRVRRFRAMTLAQRIAAPGFAFGCMADESFLLEELDGALRRLAHYRREGLEPAPSGETTMTTTLLPAVDIERPFVTPAAPTIQPPHESDHNQAIAAAARAVDASLARSITLRLPLDALRQNAVYDVRALRREPEQMPPKGGT